MLMHIIFRMNLEEEVDTLRVKTAQDSATIHELRMCLEQEQEGRSTARIH